MKRTIQMAVLALMLSAAVVSCKKAPSDADLLTAAQTAVAAINPDASVEVKDAVAHLSGTFADDATKQAALSALKGVTGIKDVMDMATVAAPAVNAIDTAVLNKVTDALKDFPTVKADVINDVLTLTGTVASPDAARKIKESIDALNIGKYENKVTVKK